jgi:hypothetical protein
MLKPSTLIYGEPLLLRAMGRSGVGDKEHIGYLLHSNDLSPSWQLAPV